MVKIYNTLSRKKENFVPINNTVRMYSCGPTVYTFAHIGNMRAYIFMDSVRRVLEYDGYKVINMINITDVGHLLSDADEGEDKMEKAGREQNKSPYEIAAEITAAFMSDIRLLNINTPKIIEKATDHISEMIDFVVKLIKKGYAYETSDGIYFDIQKFKDYGKLSGQKLEEQIAGARVEINSEKRHPADFALWKNAPKEHIMQWDSPWGPGFPGWHIECSALSRKFLGCEFDIHTGGIDHIPVHHENEIAQSEALEGKKTVNYWMHGEFMQVNGGKMSKSLKNTYTLRDLADKGFSPMAFKYFCLNTHYRKTLNFTFEALEGAQKAYSRLTGLLNEHKNGQNTADNAVLNNLKQEFKEAVCDDINIPLGIGVLWTLLKQPYSLKVFELAMDFDRVLGLKLSENCEKTAEKDEAGQIPQIVKELAKQRLEARKNKDWALSDTLRNEINKEGYCVADTKDGFTLSKN